MHDIPVDERRAMDGAAAQERQSTISGEMERLSSALDMLAGMPAGLEERLGPVLLPDRASDTASDANEKSKVSPPDRCGLAESIREFAARVFIIRERLIDLEKRIDL